MKKKYQKPSVVFESFELANVIAGNCEHISNLPSRGVCAYDAPEFDFPIFWDKMGGCTIHKEEGMYNGICYDVPTDDNNVFSS